MELALCADLPASRLAHRIRLRPLRRCPVRAGRHKGRVPARSQLWTAGGDLPPTAVGTTRRTVPTYCPHVKTLACPSCGWLAWKPPRALCPAAGSIGSAPISSVVRRRKAARTRDWPPLKGRRAEQHRLDRSGDLQRRFTAGGYCSIAWLTAPVDRSVRSAFRRLSVPLRQAGRRVAGCTYGEDRNGSGN